MRLPKMRPQSAKVLSVADFSGGLNLRDGTREILDNQLTDTKNMWWKDGVLKTRPGMKEKYSREIAHTVFDWDEVDADIKIHNVYKYDEILGNCKLFSRYVHYFGANKYNTEITFWWASDGHISSCGNIFLDEIVDNYFVIQKGATLYCFTSSQEIWQNDGAESWKKLTEEDMYAPLVATDCRTDGNSVNTNVAFAGGVAVEGYNLLSKYYKMKYSAYNSNIATITGESTTKKHMMIYHLLQSISEEKYIGEKVTVNYTLAGITYEHVVTISGANGVWREEKSPGDGMVISLNHDTITFYAEEYPLSGYSWVSETEYVQNNLEIIAPYIPDNYLEEKAKIFNMTNAEWFGGASAGLAGGTRLFLCGNSQEKDKSLVCWSGLNNPLYFPENSYYYVGNTSGAVTGFGKQSDKLIIFKENETWYTQYYQNTDITAEDLINQSVVDYTASSVYFPLVQINQNIGCPYPNTIQLCRNRLVWLGDGGNVYTLVSESQYNERSIFSVSEMVQSRLKDERPDNASACDWNGYYCLNFGDKLYLMDYNNYGYTHIASYSKTEDANIRIAWYYWELNIDEDSQLITVDGNLFTLNQVWGGRIGPSILSLNAFGENNSDDKGNSIDSLVTTKLFSFSAPNYRKNIDRIDLFLGNNGGEPIQAEVIADCGSEEHTIEMTSPQTDKRDAGYIENRAVFPCMRQISRLAVKLSSKGPLIIDGMSIKYRITGGVR